MSDITELLEEKRELSEELRDAIEGIERHAERLRDKDERENALEWIEGYCMDIRRIIERLDDINWELEDDE